MKEKELERILKSLANRRRLNIVSYLRREGPSSVGNIATEIRLSFRATSKHLQILHAAGLLEREQVSLNMLYRIPSGRNACISKIFSIV